MRAHWKPILFLLLGTPFLTELLSGSLPASKFFQPQVFLFLATAGYGFPVLLLREFAVRQRLGLVGLFFLGLAYGIYNEGVLAKTFYLSAGVPVNTFDGYGYRAGVAIPWAVMISMWHALHSFVYPVVMVGFLFPGQRQLPWLSKRAAGLMALVPLAFGILMYTHQQNDHPAGDLIHLVAATATMGLLLWLAAGVGSRPPLGEAGRWRTSAIFLGGLTFLALTLVPILLAKAKVPLPLYYGYVVVVVGLPLILARRFEFVPVKGALLFGLGDYTVIALIGLVTAIGARNAQRIATSAGFVLLFGLWLIRLRKSMAPRAGLEVGLRGEEQR